MIKAVAEAGLGVGAIIALVIVVIYQMKLMSKMTDNIKENTMATREMTETMRSFREVDRQMIQAVEYCKTKNHA